MNLGKLQRTLHKEFTKSPLKTGLLVLMCPVALYFIVPLCLPKGKAKPRKVPPLATSVAVAPQTSAPAIDPTASNWEELVEAMTQDTRMVSAELGLSARNPFQLVGDFLPEVEEVAEVEQAEELEEFVEEEAVDTQEMILTATMVSPRKRLATINGRTYREHDFILFNENTSEGTPPDGSFQLVEVGLQHAVLMRQGKEIRLDLHAAQASGITIVPAKSPGS